MPLLFWKMLALLLVAMQVCFVIALVQCHSNSCLLRTTDLGNSQNAVEAGDVGILDNAYKNPTSTPTPTVHAIPGPGSGLTSTTGNVGVGGGHIFYGFRPPEPKFVQPMDLIQPPEFLQAGALCLDGKPGGYYFRSGSTTNRSKWVCPTSLRVCEVHSIDTYDQVYATTFQR